MRVAKVAMWRRMCAVLGTMPLRCGRNEWVLPNIKITLGDDDGG